MKLKKDEKKLNKKREKCNKENMEMLEKKEESCKNKEKDEKNKDTILTEKERRLNNNEKRERKMETKNQKRTSRNKHENKEGGKKTIEYERKSLSRQIKNQWKSGRHLEKNERNERDKKNQTKYNEQRDIIYVSKKYLYDKCEKVTYKKYVDWLKNEKTYHKGCKPKIVGYMNGNKELTSYNSHNCEVTCNGTVVTKWNKHKKMDIKNTNNEIKIFKGHSINEKINTESLLATDNKGKKANRSGNTKFYKELFYFLNKRTHEKRTYKSRNHLYYGNEVCAHTKKKNNNVNDNKNINNSNNNINCINRNYVNYVTMDNDAPINMNMATGLRKRLFTILFWGLIVVVLAICNNILGRMRNQVLQNFDGLTASYNVIGYLFIYFILCIGCWKSKYIDRNQWTFIYPCLNICLKRKCADNNKKGSSRHNLYTNKNGQSDIGINGMESGNTHTNQNQLFKLIVLSRKKENDKTREPLLDQTCEGICKDDNTHHTSFQDLDESGNFIRKGYEMKEKCQTDKKDLNIYITKCSQENENDSSEYVTSGMQNKEAVDRNEPRSEINFIEKKCFTERKMTVSHDSNLPSSEKINLTKKKRPAFGGYVYIIMISIFDLIGNTLYFVSQFNIPLTVLLLLNQLNFIFSIFLSCVILSKRYNRLHFISVGIVFAGFLLFYIPYLHLHNLLRVTTDRRMTMPLVTFLTFDDSFLFQGFYFFYEQRNFVHPFSWSSTSYMAPFSIRSSIILCTFSIFLTSLSGVIREYVYKEYARTRGFMLESDDEINSEKENEFTKIRENKRKRIVSRKSDNRDSKEKKKTHTMFNPTNSALLNSKKSKKNHLANELTEAKCVPGQKDHLFRNNLPDPSNKNTRNLYHPLVGNLNNEYSYTDTKENGNNVSFSKSDKKDAEGMREVSGEQYKECYYEKNKYGENEATENCDEEMVNMSCHSSLSERIDENRNCYYIDMSESNKNNKMSIVLVALNVTCMQLCCLPLIICFQSLLEKKEFTADMNYIRNSFKCFKGYTVDNNNSCKYALLVYIIYLIINSAFNLSVNWFLSVYSSTEVFLMLKSATPITLIILYFFNFPFIPASDKFYSFYFIISAAVIFSGVTYFFIQSIKQSRARQRQKSIEMKIIKTIHKSSNLNDDADDNYDGNDSAHENFNNSNNESQSDFNDNHAGFTWRKNKMRDHRRKTDRLSSLHRYRNRLGYIQWNWFNIHCCNI